jgi:hypothetical protein
MEASPSLEAAVPRNVPTSPNAAAAGRIMVSYDDIYDQSVENDYTGEKNRAKVGALTAKVRVRPSTARNSQPSRSSIPYRGSKQSIATGALSQTHRQSQAHSEVPSNYNARPVYDESNLNNPAVAALAAAIVQASQRSTTYPPLTSYQPMYNALPPPQQHHHMSYSTPPFQPYMYYPHVPTFDAAATRQAAYPQQPSGYSGSMEHYHVPGYYAYRPPPS